MTPSGSDGGAAGDVTIRLATAADAPLLAGLMERLFRQAFADSNDPVQMDAYCATTYGADIQRAELEQQDARVWLARAGQEVVGYAQMRLSRPQSQLRRIYVDRSQHGRGLAQRLMEIVIDAARAAGAERLVLSVWPKNDRAIAFYRKYGFQVSGTQPFVLGTEVQTDWVMTLQL